MKYRVVGGVAEVGRDIRLYLTKEQLAARATQVEKDGNFCRALTVIQFKAGEEINVANKAEDIPRSLMVMLEPLASKTKTKSPRRAKTKVD